MKTTLKIIGVVLLYYLLYFSIPLLNGVTENEPPQKFEVVDTYNNCEVIRYTPVNSARYHYFLDCTKDA